MTASVEALLAAVKQACPSGLWSLGVKLAREGAVVLEARLQGEIRMRVRAPGLAVAPSVTLYPGDCEWSCDCAGRIDPCAHVAAAAIAARQTEQGGEPAQGPALALRYRFRRTDRSLVLERALVDQGGQETPLDGTLASAVARGRGLVPTHDDIKLDRLLATFRRGTFDGSRSKEVVSLLASAADVWLDDVRVEVSDEPVSPRAVVEDVGDTVVLRIVKSERITELIARGLVLCANAIHALGETDLTGDAFERLPLERAFSAGELGALVTEILPDLGKHLVVDVRTKRLPRAGRPERPRIRLEYAMGEHALSVLPTLVYGDPPRARIDDGALVHLGGPVPLRDEAAEKELVFRLRDELNLVFGRRAGFGGTDAARFLLKLERFTGDIDEGGETRFRKQMPFARFEVHDAGFDLAFELPELGGRLEGASVVRAWQEGLGWAPLLDGGWAPLPLDWLSKHGAKVSELLAVRRGDRTVPAAALPALGELCDDLGVARPAALRALEPLLAGFTQVPEAALPSDLTATLRPYQRQGVNWLAFLRDLGLGAVLADDMGLGKTVEALAAVRGRTLVVCPKSVLFNWHSEIRRFRPALSVALYHGPNRALDRKADVTLTTFAVLRIDADRLAAEVWDTAVIDEAQNIKNADSQVARASYALQASFKVALSGTPIENRLEELWSIFHFACPGLLGTRADFAARFAGPLAAGNPDVAARLRARIRPFVLRRKKSEVAPELPPRTELVITCELDEGERAMYDAVHAATRKDVLDRLGEQGGVLLALEALLRLRQAACHTGLLPGQKADGSSKLEALLGALEDVAADGHKALVFSQWTSLLDLVEPHLLASQIAFTRLDGTTRDRQAVVESFQSDSGPPVLLASLKAGGTGLNLTAADHVFLLDPWWNPAAEDQAADRAHRIGQDKPVFVYRIVAKDTVEEKILALQERKRALAEVALGEGGRAAELTRDDLLELLS